MRSVQFVTPPIVTTGVNEIVPIKAPARGYMTRLWVTGPAAFNVNIFNRAFTSDPIKISSIDNYGNGKSRINARNSLPFAAGDVVLVAGSGVAGYDKVHRITSVDGGTTIGTDVDYASDYASIDDNGGTIALQIPAAEQPLYRVLDQIAAVSGLATYIDSLGVAVINKDPLPRGRCSKNGTPVYFILSAIGTYRISMTFSLTD